MEKNHLIVKDSIIDFIVSDNKVFSNLFYLFKPKILSAISVIVEKKKWPDIDLIFDHNGKAEPPIIEKESIVFFITDLISVNLIENKKTFNGPGSFYIKI